MSSLEAPDGIRKEHAEHRRGWKRHASPLGLAIFSVTMLVAVLGWAIVEPRGRISFIKRDGGGDDGQQQGEDEGTAV